MNMGPMVGGPWDGGVHSVAIHPPDYPDGVPPEVAEVCRLHSESFPEGALYRWHAGSGEWRYDGEPAPNAFSALLEAMGMRKGLR